MNNLKISTRLFALIGALAVLLIAIGAIGLYGTDQSNASLRSVYEGQTIPIEQISEINTLNLQNRLEIANGLLFPDEAEQAAAKVEANLAKIQKTWEAFASTHMSAEESRLTKQLAEDRARLVSEGLKPAIAALRAKDAEEAKRIVLDRVRPLYGPVHTGIDAIIQLQITEAQREYESAEARYDTMHTFSIGVLTAGIVFALMFGMAIARGITRQLGAEPAEVLRVTSAIAAGNLASEITVKPGDDYSVMAGMAAMQKSLGAVVSSVRQSSESLLTASAEIAQGNQDLSSRTENQASALEETAASMEELSTTVQQNADSARQANQLALNASMVARKGGEVVQSVVETMKDINVSSRKISDIISVIDGIAFQTNILALNAAVEAARAGEQGLGFAVVATEVRSLAGRSAEAAKEIKNLISASVERVQAGTLLVDEAGTTMNEVVSAVKRVTDLMAEISAASAEQSAGVSQVGEAVVQMDQVTQQNAALVEEMAAAAASLQSQANDLVSSVAIFNTGEPARVLTTRTLQVRSTAPKTAFLGPERRSTEFNTPNAFIAHSEANRVIHSAKKQPKAAAVPVAPKVQATSPVSDEEWETF